MLKNRFGKQFLLVFDGGSYFFQNAHFSGSGRNALFILGSLKFREYCIRFPLSRFRNALAKYPL